MDIKRIILILHIIVLTIIDSNIVHFLNFFSIENSQMRSHGHCPWAYGVSYFLRLKLLLSITLDQILLLDLDLFANIHPPNVDSLTLPGIHLKLFKSKSKFVAPFLIDKGTTQKNK